MRIVASAAQGRTVRQGKPFGVAFWAGWPNLVAQGESGPDSPGLDRLPRPAAPTMEEPPIPPVAESTNLALKLRTELVARTKPERLPHVMGVEAMAVILAELWGLDRERVRIAALLHDLAKPIPREEQLALLDECTVVPAEPEDREHPAIWHGFISAQQGHDDFAIAERDILEAVAYHSTGNPGMSDLGLVLYVADFTEPHRKFDGAEAHRAFALRSSLADASRHVAEAKLAHLARKGREPHSRTRAMLEWLRGR